MNEIEWFTFAMEPPGSPEAAKGPVTLPHIPVFPELVKEYNIRQSHTRCPAFIDAMSNTFLLRSDINIDLRFDPVSRKLDVRDDSEATSAVYIHNRDPDNYPEGAIAREKGNMTFSITQYQIFMSEDDIEVELIPCLYHESDFTNKTHLIVGRFNINRWLRPTEVAAMVRHTSYKDTKPVEISIKRGDPLMYIRFHPANGKPVKLKRIVDQKRIDEYIRLATKCVSIKKILPGLSLQKMYDMFNPFRPKVKKCPFNWRK